MITAYTGKPGSGKTYSMARDCAIAMERGSEVWANFALRGAHYFKDLEEIINVEKGIVAIDELNTIMPAAKWQRVPTEHLALFTQSRHADLDMFYTTQSFRKVVNVVRDITNEVWVFDWVFRPKFRNSDKHKKKSWRYRWHTAELYSAEDVENAYKRVKPLQKFRFWENKDVFAIYDTKFRVRAPVHLRGMDDITDLDPMMLPKFDDNLQIATDLFYEKVSTAAI